VPSLWDIPLSFEPTRDADRIVRYVLRALPDEEAEHLDEASIADDEFAARLRSVENDLVDAYVCGTLDRATCARFEAVYLGTAHRREKVEFAKRFLAAVDRVSAPPNVVVRRWRFVRPLQAAAAVVLVACGALVVEDLRLRQRLDLARGETAAQAHRTETLVKQLDDARAAATATAEAASAVERSRASIAGNQQPTSQTRSSVTPARMPSAPLAIVLSPQTRSLGPLPTIATTPATESIAFELRLDANDFPRYHAVLKDPIANRILWRSGVLRARPLGGAAGVSITMPAGALRAQHYALELTGFDAVDRSERVGTYLFELERR
jgi:hypothetical protein